MSGKILCSYSPQGKELGAKDEISLGVETISCLWGLNSHWLTANVHYVHACQI